MSAKNRTTPAKNIFSPEAQNFLSSPALSGKGDSVREVNSFKKTFLPLFPLAAALFLFIFLGDGNAETGIVRCAALLAAVPPLLVYFSEKTYLQTQLSTVEKGFILFDGALEKAEKVNLTVFTISSGLSEGNLRVERIYTKNVPEKDILLYAASFYGGNDAFARALQAALKEPAVIADEIIPSLDSASFSVIYKEKTYTVTKSYNLERLGISCSPDWLNTLPKTKSLFAVAEEHTAIGFISLSDTVNPTATAAAEKLNTMTETLLLSQESNYQSKTISKQLGINKHLGGLSPRQKEEELEKLALDGNFIMYTGMLPEALSGSGLSVKITGEGEGFDAVLLDADLNLLPEILTFSKKKIFRLRLVPLLHIGLAAAFAALCLTGVLSPLFAALLGLAGSVFLKLV